MKALKGSPLEVKEGEFLVIIGLSGSGKSTMLRCLNLLHEPTGGEIYYRGNLISGIKRNKSRLVKQKIGMIFSAFQFDPRYSVLKNALTGSLGANFVAASLLGWFKQEDKEKH